MKKSISGIVLATVLASPLLFPGALQAQESGSSASLEAKVKELKNEVEKLQFDNDQLAKAVDDLNWYKKMEEVAYVDKVRISSLPPTVVRNPTGKGVKNPVTIQAYVFIPKNIDYKKKYPLIVLPHGGVHGNFGSGNAHIVKELIAQGYVVTAPEYRGSTGYGRTFQRQIDYGGREVDDTKASRDYMLQTYDFIDKSRVGIIGWSHGGMLTLLNLFRFPESYAVGYAGVPVSDLVARMGYMNEEYRKLFSADYHLGKEVFQNVAEYRKRSPAWNAEKLKTPLLIHANTNDEDVNILEVEHLIKSLKAENKKFEYKIYDSFPGGHHFDRIDNYASKEIRMKVYQFLQPILKPATPFKDLDALIKASYFPAATKPEEKK